MQDFLHDAWTCKLNVCIAGGAAAFGRGILKEFSDVDIFMGSKELRYTCFSVGKPRKPRSREEAPLTAGPPVRPLWKKSHFSKMDVIFPRLLESYVTKNNRLEASHGLFTLKGQGFQPVRWAPIFILLKTECKN